MHNLSFHFLNQCITENELNWQLQLNLDVMLTPSKFVDEEFEWHSKEGIPGNIKKLLDEFCKLRKLRPIKIILNSNDKEQRSLYAEKIAKFVSVPTHPLDLDCCNSFPLLQVPTTPFCNILTVLQLFSSQFLTMRPLILTHFSNNF